MKIQELSMTNEELIRYLQDHKNPLVLPLITRLAQAEDQIEMENWELA